MLPNPPSKHHYIPEFLLKRWTAPDGRLSRYTSPIRGKIVHRRCYSSEVGFQRDLYRSAEKDPWKAQQLESGFFAALDNAAAKALDGLLVDQSGTLDRASLEIWCVFIFALLHRTPTYFEALIRGGKREFFKATAGLEARYAEMRKPDDPATFREFVDGLNDQKAMLRTMAIIPGLILKSNIIAFLHGMHWAVLCIGTMQPNLLLGDDPLVRTNGLKREGGHVAIPISPTHLMIGTWQPDLLRDFQSTAPLFLVKQVNQQTVETAREFVVATDERQARFVHNRFGAKPRPPLVYAED